MNFKEIRMHITTNRATHALLSLLAAIGVGLANAQTPSNSEAQKAAMQIAKGIRAVTGGQPAPKALPTGDPCAILSLADVQKAFPGAKAGERSRRLEEYGITECGWKGPDKVIVLEVHESYTSTSTTARDEALGMAQGVTDPLKPQSLKNVRIESFADLGVDAAAFVETADPKRGILGDGALMELRRGNHAISLGSSELARRDRGAALKAFADLGRAAAKRLQ
jgi:hypothetical protein